MANLDIAQSLEYPLPVLSVSSTELVVDDEITFNIKNSGGGTLEGRIVSPTDSIVFEPDHWEGNRQDILCRFSPDASDSWKPGDTRTFQVQLLSNGGALVLPVTVRLSKMAINVIGDAAGANATAGTGATAGAKSVSIANLQDFYSYSADYPEEAQKLFSDDEFHQLLIAMDFAYVDAYVLLTKESNVPQALDNFFILAGLKRKTILIVDESKIEHKSITNGMIYGEFVVYKSDSGYAEAEIRKINESPWLKIENEGRFCVNNTLIVKYSIDPLLIKSRYAIERVSINEDIYVDIIFKRPLPIRAWLPKEGYRLSDEGQIIVENEADVNINVICNEPFVRFFQQEYKTKESPGRLEIPFLIKLTPLQTAQMMFRKIPSLSATIEIRAEYKDTVISKLLTLTAGEW